MKLKIPVGISDFEEIHRNGYYYIDKSALIRELLTVSAAKVTLITRPRRFGKTLGMSMLSSFFDIRKDSCALFDGLEVSEDDTLCRDWMNQWPTLFLSFKDVDGLNFSSAWGMLRNQIAFLFNQHSYLAESSRVNENDRKRMMGHSFGNDITNATYGHRTLEDLRSEIEKIQVPICY